MFFILTIMINKGTESDYGACSVSNVELTNLEGSLVHKLRTEILNGRKILKDQGALIIR